MASFVVVIVWLQTCLPCRRCLLAVTFVIRPSGLRHVAVRLRLSSSGHRLVRSSSVRRSTSLFSSLALPSDLVSSPCASYRGLPSSSPCALHRSDAHRQTPAFVACLVRLLHQPAHLVLLCHIHFLLALPCLWLRPIARLAFSVAAIIWPCLVLSASSAHRNQTRPRPPHRPVVLVAWPVIGHPCLAAAAALALALPSAPSLAPVGLLSSVPSSCRATAFFWTLPSARPPAIIVIWPIALSCPSSSALLLRLVGPHHSGAFVLALPCTPCLAFVGLVLLPCHRPPSISNELPALPCPSCLVISLVYALQRHALPLPLPLSGPLSNFACMPPSDALPALSALSVIYARLPCLRFIGFGLGLSSGSASSSDLAFLARPCLPSSLASALSSALTSSSFLHRHFVRPSLSACPCLAPIACLVLPNVVIVSLADMPSAPIVVVPIVLDVSDMPQPCRLACPLPWPRAPSSPSSACPSLALVVLRHLALHWPLPCLCLPSFLSAHPAPSSSFLPDVRPSSWPCFVTCSSASCPALSFQPCLAHRLLQRLALPSSPSSDLSASPEPCWHQPLAFRRYLPVTFVIVHVHACPCAIVMLLPSSPCPPIVVVVARPYRHAHRPYRRRPIVQTSFVTLPSTGLHFSSSCSLPDIVLVLHHALPALPSDPQPSCTSLALDLNRHRARTLARLCSSSSSFQALPSCQVGLSSPVHHRLVPRRRWLRRLALLASGPPSSPSLYCCAQTPALPSRRLVNLAHRPGFPHRCWPARSGPSAGHPSLPSSSSPTVALPCLAH